MGWVTPLRATNKLTSTATYSYIFLNSVLHCCLQQQASPLFTKPNLWWGICLSTNVTTQWQGLRASAKSTIRPRVPKVSKGLNQLFALPGGNGENEAANCSATTKKASVARTLLIIRRLPSSLWHAKKCDSFRTKVLSQTVSKNPRIYIRQKV